MPYLETKKAVKFNEANNGENQNLFINYNSQCGEIQLFPKPSRSVNGRHREESNKMLSCRPDETAICRQLGLISDDELGVKAERKARTSHLGDLGKLAAGDMNNMV